MERLAVLEPDAHIVSAYSGDGVEGLRAAVEALLPTPGVHVEALLPYSEGALLSRIREYGHVQDVQWQDDGVHVSADVDDRLSAQIVAAAID